MMHHLFWKGKRILVTGHTGFKGSWLSLWLQKKGAHAIGYALAPSTEPSLFDLAGVAEGMVSIFGDIRDLPSLQSVIFEYKPEIIIHLAAQPLVRRSYEDPIETFTTNIMGTVNLLEAIRNSDTVKSAVIITSDKCYENHEWIWGYRENDSMGGHDPYSSSKGCAELATSAYIRSYFSTSHDMHAKPAVATARAGNVIGGGDWSRDRLVPDIMTAILQGHAAAIRSPAAIRPWQHVLEPLRGYLMLAEKLFCMGHDYTGAWNFGPEDRDAKPVSWIVERLAAQWGDGATWRIDANEHAHEATYLKLDCTKARQLLGWNPAINLSTALDWIAEWYQCMRRGGDMRRQTIEQISRYEQLTIGKAS